MDNDYAEVKGPDTRKVKDMVHMMNDGRLQIPQIQRGFVWPDELIREFYDSLMKDYFIGSMMFWDASRQSAETPEVFRDIRENLVKKKSDFSGTSDGDDMYLPKSLVFDGQQRLTALYYGTISKTDTYNKQVFNKDPLYVNLFSGFKEWEKDKGNSNKKIIASRYGFRIGKPKVVDRKREYWVEFNVFLKEDEDAISEIRKNVEEDIKKWEDDGIITPEIGGAMVGIARDVIKRASLVPTRDIQKHNVSGNMFAAIELFRKINNSGKKVTGSELMLSFFWGINPTMRNKCKELVEDIETSFEGGDKLQEILIRLSLYICDKSIDFGSKALNNADIQGDLKTVAENWEKITKIFRYTVRLFDSYNLWYPIKRHNVMLVMALYLYIRDYSEESFNILIEKKGSDWRKLKSWTALTIFKQTLTGTSNTKLKNMRTVIQRIKTEKNPEFPSKELIDEFGQTVDEEELSNMLSTKKSQRNKIYALFSLMDDGEEKRQRGGKLFHIDHIYPKASASSEEEEEYDSVLNLQLLSQKKNSRKATTPPNLWFAQQAETLNELDSLLRSRYIQIPDINGQKDVGVARLASDIFENHEDFFEKRRDYLAEIIKERCKEIGALNILKV